ncbi:2TM domain-containing protein [Confluentibacter sediminis]|uniref:2TM domain-containing protein n=1 Tax=Confluentibacter sediminis TaxID=2219045 RepID=UPI000DAE363C|nr:2TM domain-containing protein [Confluentibacter sediminis]
MENFNKQDAYYRAEKRLKQIKGFYAHLLWYLIINIILIGIIATNGGDLLEFKTYSTAFYWGIGMVFHAIGVFGKNPIFSKKWEERKIQEYMDKEHKTWE